jgi:hypothetical protein
MAPILVPHDGLTLAQPALPKPDNDNAESGSMPTQAMLLDLDDGVLDEVLKIARNGGKGVSVAFGKTIVRLPIEKFISITIQTISSHVHRCSTTEPSPNA